jgi:hypothetical protein
MPIILSWIATNISPKIMLYLAAAVAVFFLYLSWKHNIEHQALLEFNQKQIEQVAKDQASLTKKLNDLTDIQSKFIEDEKQYKESIDRKLSNFNSFLGSDAAKKLDGPAPEILKKTIKELAQ